MQHQWTDLHASLLVDFCATLSYHRIRYFILRNYEELPERNRGKDVDIVFEPFKYKEVEGILLNILRKYDIGYYTITKFDGMRCWYIMDFYKKFAIHIDLIENELYKGFEFFDFDSLYAHTVKYKNFVVLDKVYDTVLLLVQNLIAYKSLKEKYRNTIYVNYQECGKEINQVLIDFWGTACAAFIDKAIQDNHFDELVSKAGWLEKMAIRRIFRKRPFYTSKNIVRFLAGKVYRILWCPRKFWRFIAVEAPDGTGKTTFITNLIEQLQYYYVSDPDRFQLYHFRPGLLPNLGAAGEKMKLMREDTDFTNPHRAKPANRFSSLIRMFYYWLDYVIGVPIVIRKDTKYERYTIFDRYIYDFLVDPHRSRINLPYWVRKLFVFLCAKPQMVFVLHADADVIYGRKQELSKDEIRRQLKAFSRLATSKRFIVMDANQDAQIMAEQATLLVMNKFMNKIP